MSIEGISISFTEVSTTAQSIKNINDILFTRLEDIKKEMLSLKNTWQSDASGTIQGKFEALVPRFEEHKTIVNSYVDFLNKTVESYETNETKLNNKADNSSLFK